MKAVKRFFFWLLCFAVFLLLLPLILLIAFAPLRYAVVARIGDNTTVRAKASYLFRLITVQYVYTKGEGKNRIRVAGMLVGGTKNNKNKIDDDPIKTPSTKEPPEESQKEPAEESINESTNEPTGKPEKKSSTIGFNKLKGILTYPELKTIIRLALQWFKKTARVLLPKRLDVSGTVDFSDPAATGMFLGFYESVAALLSLRHKVQLAANFSEPGIRLKISAGGSLSIARLTWPILWLVLKKPIRKFITYVRG
jgi:hypothetical protein